MMTGRKTTTNSRRGLITRSEMTSGLKAATVLGVISAKIRNRTVRIRAAGPRAPSPQSPRARAVPRAEPRTLKMLLPSRMAPRRSSGLDTDSRIILPLRLFSASRMSLARGRLKRAVSEEEKKAEPKRQIPKRDRYQVTAVKLMKPPRAPSGSTEAVGIKAGLGGGYNSMPEGRGITQEGRWGAGPPPPRLRPAPGRRLSTSRPPGPPRGSPERAAPRPRLPNVPPSRTRPP